MTRPREAGASVWSVAEHPSFTPRKGFRLMPASSTLLTLDRFRRAVSRNETARQRNLAQAQETDAADGADSDAEAQRA